MKRSVWKRIAGDSLGAGLLVLMWVMFGLPAGADIVLVESRSGGQNFAFYNEMTGVGGVWANSSAKATVSPCTTGIGCRYGYTNATYPQLEGELKGPGFFVSPPLGVAGQDGVYKIEITMGTANTSASSDLQVSVWFTNCSGTVLNGKAGSPANTTTNFQYVSAASTPLNVWRLVGYLTNHAGISQPTVCFQYYDGTVSSAKRFVADAVLFTHIGDLCVQVPTPAVNGPLAAGQNRVHVSNVVTNATKLNIYRLMGSPPSYDLIGSTSSPVAGVVNSITVTQPIYKDDLIIATQVKDGIESCKETPTPARVGGGANPAGGLRVVFNIRENTNAAPPLGANGGTGGDVFFLGSDNRVGGIFGAAPTVGQVVMPSTDWQTVTLTRGIEPLAPIDPTYCWSTTGQPTLDGNYGVLDSIGFAINDLTDTGPYAVYIGKVINGSTVIQDFSNATNGEPTVMFSLPSAVGTSGQTGNLLAQPPGTYSPNESVVVNTNGSTSGKSALVSWQWNNTQPTTWLQLLARGSGTPNPVVDLRQPITVELLMLPVGTATGRPAVNATTITNQAVWTTSDATMSVSSTEPGATYQWYWGYPQTGYPLPDGNTTSYTINGMQPGNNGVYTVVVTAGGRVTSRSTYLYSVDPIPTITNFTTFNAVAPGFTGVALKVEADGHVEAGYPLYYQWRKDGMDLPGQNGSSLVFPAGAQISDAGLYEVQVGNAYGSVVSAVAVLYVVAEPLGTGTGLLGSYWTTRTNTFTATPTLTRNDSNVNFEWGAASPASSISTNYFTARWAGQVQALGSDTYTFYTVSDDGVRLWVDGQLLIDNWTGHSPITNSGAIQLAGVNRYDVVLEYFENTGGATIKLWWEKATGGVPQSAVPVTQLYPAAAATPAVTLTAPADGLSFQAPATVDLAATVERHNYLITGVEFYTNGVVFATDNTAPYAAAIAGLPIGVYKLQARVLFNGGNPVGDVVGSSTNTITVLSASPPSVSIGLSGGNVTISGSGQPGQNFVLFKTPALSPPAWTPVQTNSAGTGEFSFIIVPGTEPAGFFRVGTQ